MVAPVTDAGVAHVLGQRIDARRLGQRAMERRIEAGDLCQPRHQGRDRSQAADVERLVRRLHRAKTVQVGQHLVVDAHGRVEADAAQRHAVPRRDDSVAGQMPLQPGDHETQGFVRRQRTPVGPVVPAQRSAGSILDDENRLRMQAIDAAPDLQRRLMRYRDAVGRELQAGRARVEDQEDISHACSSSDVCRVARPRSTVANPRRVLSMLADVLVMLRELLSQRRDRRDVELADLANRTASGPDAIQ